MKKITIVTIFLIGHFAFSQVGIGNTDPKSTLDISASNITTPTNTDGILIPRVDEFPATNPTIEQDGMMVFVTGNGTPTKGFYYWDNSTTVWVSVNGGVDTQNTLDEAYDEGGAGVGRIITADNGAVEIQDAGGLRVESDITVGNSIIHDGDPNTFIQFTPDRIEMDAGGTNYIDIQNTNQEITLNEDSNAIDFRVESGNETHMLFVDGSNDAVGIGQNNPVSPLHIGISTIFNLNGTNIGQDGIFIKGGGANTGLNAKGGSLSFGGATDTRENIRKAAISLVQTGADEDLTGLAFYVHQTIANSDPMTEGMRLTHNKYLGINNNDPDANLDVIGTMQYVDGNEATGFILASDANGNATWTNPSTLVTDTNTQNTLDEAYDEGGAGAGRTITADSGAFLIQGDDGFQNTGTFNSGATLALSGSGTKMFFYPRKAAFRAGNVSGAEWDNATIGNYSFAINQNTTASGSSSVAINNGTTASGPNSFAQGTSSIASGTAAASFGNSTASGNASFAAGQATTASGANSATFGRNTSAPSYGEMAVGSFPRAYGVTNPTAFDSSDRAFVIGNGTGVGTLSHNALEVWKDGRVEINEAYSFPLTDGTANQVLTTDGAGVTSWTTPAGGTTTSIVRALLSSSQLLPLGTPTKISFDTTLFDTNSDFDTTNNRFVAPRDGYYRVNAAIAAFNSSTGGLFVQIYKNGTWYQRENFGVNSTSQFKTIDGIVALNAGEYVEIFVNASPANYNVSVAYTFFEIQEIK